MLYGLEVILHDLGFGKAEETIVNRSPIWPQLEKDTYLGGCQNYGPFLGTLNIRCRIKIGTQKGTIILTATHLYSVKEKS